MIIHLKDDNEKSDGFLNYPICRRQYTKSVKVTTNADLVTCKICLKDVFNDIKMLEGLK